MDNRYNIDFDKLGEQNTPDELKASPDQRAWISVLLNPIKTLYDAFILFCNMTWYDLFITGQVCSLERMLNNRYDFTLRRIYIDDAALRPTKYIFKTAESKPKFLRKRSENSPMFIYTSGENINSADNFIVYVPLDIPIPLPEIISLLKSKRLPGKRFKIQRF